MASQALYRKWRSQTFDEMVGQEALKQTLKNALSSGKLAHAYLFTGPRGTGKTTTARLLAKTINCPNARDGEPCNECQQCREITAGNSFNVIEIDAASNRGIDSIRELREKIKMPPAAGKYKVYILDEAHMLTVEAFNALLKTLEEPPPHAVIVMATTDVHKMLPTVLSRCQRFDFKRFATREIVEHLKHIAGLEQIQLEAGAPELIARAAAGGMRDALSLLDQAIAYSGQTIAVSQVQAMLGVADPRAIQNIIRAVSELDSSAGLHLIHALSNVGADLRQVNNQISEYWRAMMLSRAGANIGEILDSTEDEVLEVVQMALLFGLEELIECARIFAQNDLVQRNQGTPQLGLELALLACMEQHRRAQSGASAYPAPAQPVRAAVPQPSRPIASSPPPRSEPPAAHNETPLPPLVPMPSVVDERNKLAELPDWDGLSYRDDEPKDAPVSGASVAAGGPGLTVDDVRERWELVKRRIKTRKDGGKIEAFLKRYIVVGVENATPPVVVIQAQVDFHYKIIQQKSEYIETIEWGLKVALDLESCRVKLLPPGAGPPGFAVSNGLPSEPPSGPVFSLRDATVTPQRSAYREQPAQSQPPRRQPENQVATLTAIRPVRTLPDDIDGIPLPTDDDAPGNVDFSPPLARIGAVRENTTVPPRTIVKLEPSGTRLESARQNAADDPRVQKVQEAFKAQIKEVKLK